jgi:N utilization substance protein B
MPNKNTSPRVRVIQKLYGNSLNPDAEIEYQKSQYKKFIKDVVKGTIERNDLIIETINKYIPDDLDLKKTDKLLQIIIFAGVFELMFKHNNPTKVIINEYVKTSEFFLEKAQIKFLNAILDKISKSIRKPV